MNKIIDLISLKDVDPSNHSDTLKISVSFEARYIYLYSQLNSHTEYIYDSYKVTVK